MVIAAYNACDFIGAAIGSALAQTMQSIEVIVIDDCSTDATRDIVRALAQQDSRVRLIELDRNGGPAEARNVGFDAARGEWIAILDSDDLMAPNRLATLAAAGPLRGADIIADDLVIFDDTGNEAPYILVGATEPTELTLAHYLQQCVMYTSGKPYGYLKPMFRRSAVRSSGVRYDPRLRIAEDDDLIVRLLAAGLRYVLEPVASYGYRKHASSISHRLSYANAMAMMHGGERHLALRPHDPDFRRRLVAFRRAAAFAELIEALSSRQWGRTIRILIANPKMWALLRMPVMSKFRRLVPQRPRAADPRAVAALATMGRGIAA